MKVRWIFTNLQALILHELSDCTSSVDSDTAINKVVLLQTRIDKNAAAAVVAGGPHGHVHFWNTSKGGHVLARFSTVSLDFSVLL